MSNVIFFILHEVGSLNASFRLANDLKARAHRVTYVGVADSRELVEANGFAFVTLFQEHFPKGSVGELTNQGVLRQGLAHLLWAPRRHLVFRRFVDYLLAGGDEEFFSALGELRPDIILFSGGPYIEWPALMAQSRGIQSAYFCSTLAPRDGTGLPPMSSAIIPRRRESLWSAARIWVAWKRIEWRKRLLFFGHDRLTRRVAAKYGLVAFRRKTAYPRELAVSLTEIVPFPSCFDFPSSPLPDQHYIGASIGLERREVAFPWRLLDADKPLVYCALGTYLWRSPEIYRRFYRAMLDAAETTPEWQWVLATGGAASLEELGAIPANAVVVAHAPQIALLKRASVMVSHGGANTVKECIFLGVPMVIFPLGGDHPGIAARATYHGVATNGGELADVDGARLKSLVEATMNNPYIGVQLAIMQARFAEEEAEGRGVTLLESILRSQGRSSAEESAPADAPSGRDTKLATPA
ncbi:nucleotide disphospho-sugar-binding domain-containing protein [Methylosinus sp. Ce-a6]|uniref:nucleotide disphospho-sugar-binding domain-containing protein n=1 Tax=Methylosinus sp. Ce-a6 TaxID=2172005 RepID=UPI00135720CA|nr:nucleotide disphospho-sugar-binding domain-containing protein [Methylosinus sp. Ce-a6]